jgi:Transcriptional repressor TCF25
MLYKISSLRRVWDVQSSPVRLGHILIPVACDAGVTRTKCDSRAAASLPIPHGCLVDIVRALQGGCCAFSACHAHPVLHSCVLCLHGDLESNAMASDCLQSMGEQSTADDMLDRCLYAFEMAWHHSFSVATANCMLDPERKENKGFYEALFRQLQVHYVARLVHGVCSRWCTASQQPFLCTCAWRCCASLETWCWRSRG